MERYRIKRIFFVFGALLAGAWFYTLDVSSDNRTPNKRERFFQYAAVEANVPELCEKISADAIVVSGFGSDGNRVYSSRSQCFYQTAIRHSKRSLCLKVKSVNNIAHWGYKISTLGCWLEIGKKRRKGSPSAISPDDKTVMTMFREMGYTVDGEIDALPMKPIVNIKRVFRRLFRKSDLTQRLLAAVKLKNKIPIEDFEYLSDMLAKSARDPKWCRNIRSGVRHPTEEKGKEKGSIDFRSNCIFFVAIGSGNENYCAELSNKPMFPGQHEIWWPANDCRSSVRHDLKRKEKEGSSYFGYYTPRDEKQILRLFKLLGSDLPSESDQPIHLLAARYRYLLGDIANGKISRDDPKVKTLLRRLTLLDIAVKNLRPNGKVNGIKGAEQTIGK